MIHPEIFEETQGLIDKLFNPSPFTISKQRSMPTNIIQTERNELDGKWLNELIQHMTNKNCITIEYNKTGLAGKRYRLAPLGLKQYRGKWYLIGHDLEDFKRDQKVFRVSRIQNLYRIQDAFPSITEYFDLQEYFKYSIGIHQKLNGQTIKVTLLLKDPFWIQELSLFKVNETQSITEIGINEALLEFETYDSPELIEFILSLGKGAQLISPESVQRRLKDQLKEILNNY
jgi:predicted DNA-binding transcriptional regulator YafY